MKKLLLCMMIFVFGCEDFSTSYERIDDREFRLLDFVYEPVDVAPGDSLTVNAIFAGKNIEDIDAFIDWKISFNVNINLFGETTVLDEIPLVPISRRLNRKFSDNTQTVSFRFKIPEDIVRTSSSIPHNWIDMLPSSMRSIVPPQFADLTKYEVVDIIEELAENWRGYYSFEEGEHTLRTLLQFFTVPIRISAKLNDPNSRFKQGHTIESTHSVRYNRRFRPVAAINTNPIIDEVEVFRVRGDVLYADWWEADRVFRLGITANTSTATPPSSRENEIVFEDGYSYFLSAYSDDYDFNEYYWTLDGNRAIERQPIFRYFQLSGPDFPEVDHSRYMTVNNWTGRIYPPTDRRITDFIFWVLVEDEAQNERLRPQGSALAEVSGKFVYR